MTKIFQWMRTATLACTLAAGAAGVAVSSTVLTATPALASGPCTDAATAQPTPMHHNGSDSSATVKFLNAGDFVSGSCTYIDNESEQRWYMQVDYTGPNNNNGYAYIWIQRLSFGSRFQCDNSGLVFSIGNAYCPLELRAN